MNFDIPMWKLYSGSNADIKYRSVLRKRDLMASSSRNGNHSTSELSSNNGLEGFTHGLYCDEVPMVGDLSRLPNVSSTCRRTMIVRDIDLLSSLTISDICFLVMKLRTNGRVTRWIWRIADSSLNYGISQQYVIGAGKQWKVVLWLNGTGKPSSPWRMRGCQVSRTALYKMPIR